MPSKSKKEVLSVAGREVTVTSPDKVYFAAAGYTKLDVVRYYLGVAEGALRGIANRPLVLKRYVDGADKPAFYQKRAPESRPEWMQTVELAFPSGRTASELVVRDAAQLIWVVNLGCIELHPHAVRGDDLDHPDELRVDLDPGPGVSFEDVKKVALETRAVLEEHGLQGFPKTSGSRGMHIDVRIEQRWSFTQVRRAALALAREVERRAPALATSKWWKEERHGVFLDYNQNAKDRTTASAYSVRPTPDARVSMPLTWDDVPLCDPADFTLRTVPEHFAAHGDAREGIDAKAFSLDPLLELSARQEAEGQGDAPWPPHFAKQEHEPPRVNPKRATGTKSAKKKAATRTKRTTGTTAAVSAESATGARRSKFPLLVISRAKDKADALAGLERWKARHPDVARQLHAEDVLVDTMRGRSSTWTRVRVNLQHVPEAERPPQETVDPDYDPTAE